MEPRWDKPLSDDIGQNENFLRQLLALGPLRFELLRNALFLPAGKSNPKRFSPFAYSPNKADYNFVAATTAKML